MKPEQLQKAYAKAIADLDAADRKLVRTIGMWMKIRRRARRYELQLEKLFAESLLAK